MPNFFAKILVQLQDDSSASKKTTEPKKEEKEDGKPKYSQKYIKELNSKIVLYFV